MSQAQQKVQKGKGKATTKKKIKKHVTNGRVHIQASFNNTLVYIVDLDGNVLGWSTAGAMGFKGSRKSTPYAAQMAAKKVGQHVKDLYGLRFVDVIISGPGPGREAAARALQEFYRVNSITDGTGIAHNGCRAEKERRV